MYKFDYVQEKVDEESYLRLNREVKKYDPVVKSIQWNIEHVSNLFFSSNRIGNKRQ